MKQVELATDEARRLLLSNFISSLMKGKWWINDKGIVILHEYHDRGGKLCWMLTNSIEDRYKDNPPGRFADVEGDIVLIYDADQDGRVKPTEGDATVLNRCLEQIIGDRVYTRPATKTRWTSAVRPFTNIPRTGGNRWITAGNGGSLLVIFEPDGSYKTYTPL